MIMSSTSVYSHNCTPSSVISCFCCVFCFLATNRFSSVSKKMCPDIDTKERCSNKRSLLSQGVNRKQIRALYQVVLLLCCAAQSSPLQLHMSLKRNQRDCMCKGLQQMEDVSVPTAVVFVNKACFDVPVRAV